jgi:hypothetical protein
MSEIFMSYAGADRTRVEPLVNAIEAQRLDVWWDRDIAYGESYHRVIERALDQARCVVVVWSAESVQSEWVTNEASEARKRGILVPLLLDDVEPPLEFRHLQSARLFDWHGESDDPELHQLIAAVHRVLQKSGSRAPTATPGSPVAVDRGKTWWETPAALALGGAGLLLAAGFFLLALRQVGLIGPGRESSTAPTASFDSAGSADPVAVGSQPAAAPAAATASGRARSAPGSGAVNLLDVRDGAQIVAANEAGWKDYIYSRDMPSCSVIATRGFVTFAFRDERLARFDRLGVYVEATNGYNLNTLELYASDQSDQGPFQKVTTVAVPNYRNERQPFHQFTFEPVTARYVKIVPVDWQAGRTGGPNGLVCTMQLYGTLL